MNGDKKHLFQNKNSTVSVIFCSKVRLADLNFGCRHVSGSDLLVAGTHVYNHFKDCNDMNSYLSSDTINDVIALSVDKVCTNTDNINRDVYINR